MANRFLIDLGPLRQSRDFRLLFAGQMVNMLGNQLAVVAIPFQVYELTRSSLQVGGVSLAQLIPLVVGALAGGSVADAVGRRAVMLVTALALAATSTALAVNASIRPSLRRRHLHRQCPRRRGRRGLLHGLHVRRAFTGRARASARSVCDDAGRGSGGHGGGSRALRAPAPGRPSPVGVRTRCRDQRGPRRERRLHDDSRSGTRRCAAESACRCGMEFAPFAAIAYSWAHI